MRTIYNFIINEWVYPFLTFMAFLLAVSILTTCLFTQEAKAQSFKNFNIEVDKIEFPQENAALKLIKPGKMQFLVEDNILVDIIFDTFDIITPIYIDSDSFQDLVKGSTIRTEVRSRKSYAVYDLFILTRKDSGNSWIVFLHRNQVVMAFRVSEQNTNHGSN